MRGFYSMFTAFNIVALRILQRPFLRAEGRGSGSYPWLESARTPRELHGSGPWAQRCRCRRRSRAGRRRRLRPRVDNRAGFHPGQAEPPTCRPELEPADAHDLVKPAVQVAAIASPLAVSLYCSSRSILTKDAVIVVDQEAWTCVPGCAFADLLLDPEKRRVGCDVHMDDPSRVDLHDDKDMGDGEEGSVLGEEVAHPKLFAVVSDEGAPGLLPPPRGFVRRAAAEGAIPRIHCR